MEQIDALDCGEHIEDAPCTFTGSKQCCTPIIHKSHEVPYHGRAINGHLTRLHVVTAATVIPRKGYAGSAPVIPACQNRRRLLRWKHNRFYSGGFARPIMGEPSNFCLCFLCNTVNIPGLTASGRCRIMKLLKK